VTNVVNKLTIGRGSIPSIAYAPRARASRESKLSATRKAKALASEVGVEPPPAA
jgi:hypothetical protein